MKIGQYQGTVVDATLSLDSIGGQQIEILIEEGQEGSGKGERVLFVGSFSGDAGPYTLDRMILAGYQIGADPESMIGSRVHFIVFEEVYKNKPRNKVDIIKPIGALQSVESRRIKGKAAVDFLSRVASLPRPERKASHSNRDDGELPPEAYR